MKELWLHRYSVASFGLSFADLYVSFVAMSTWYWGAPYNYRTGVQGELAWFPLLLGLMSAGLAAVAVAKERPKRYGFAAVAVSAPTYLLCLLRHAV
jgi:hypothetical protein